MTLFDPTATTAAVTACVSVALSAGHWLGDHPVQPDTAAAGKGQPTDDRLAAGGHPWTGWSHLTPHVASAGQQGRYSSSEEHSRSSTWASMAGCVCGMCRALVRVGANHDSRGQSPDLVYRNRRLARHSSRASRALARAAIENTTTTPASVRYSSVLAPSPRRCTSRPTSSTLAHKAG